MNKFVPSFTKVDIHFVLNTQYFLFRYMTCKVLKFTYETLYTIYVVKGTGFTKIKIVLFRCTNIYTFTQAQCNAEFNMASFSCRQ